MTDTECSRRCGYVSSGADLIDHETREHVTCTECGRSPVDAWTAVTHKPDCPRIAPEGSPPFTEADKATIRDLAEGMPGLGGLMTDWER